MAERIWIMLSALLAITAAVCLWRNNWSAAFVTGALGACAWFLSYRAQIRARVVAAEQDSDERENTEGSNEN
jgi:F0F1-type ATP synthase assembly protein I